MPGSEPLPDGTTIDDVIAAIQAAWLAEDVRTVRNLIDRYLDSPPHQFCFNCVQQCNANGLFQFRYPACDETIVRLCGDCWHAIDRRRRDKWGPGVTVGALLRDSFYDDPVLGCWVT